MSQVYISPDLELVKKWVAKSQPSFSQILHISPILVKITKPFPLLQQKLNYGKLLISTEVTEDNISTPFLKFRINEYTFDAVLEAARRFKKMDHKHLCLWQTPKFMGDVSANGFFVLTLHNSFFHKLYLWSFFKWAFKTGPVAHSKSQLGWFSVGICKYKPGYKSHDLL